VAEDLAEDRGLGDEARDPHPLAATAKERIDLVDATDQPCPRFPADRKHPAFVARFQLDLLLRMAEARGIAELRGMLPELRERVEEAALEIREGRVPPESLSVARRGKCWGF
jgi:hypothetical protein